MTIIKGDNYKTHIVIATRNRREKLIRTLESIQDQNIISEIHLVFDGDPPGFKHFIGLGYHCILINGHRGAVYCRNQVIRKLKDHPVIYATDDIVFKPGAILAAYNKFIILYPDGDGVIGFNQTGNKKFHKTGVAMVGQKWLDRYPYRDLFYPEYFHFACQEIMDAAVAVDKFHFCQAATVHHHNPMIEKTIDQTHADARIHRDRDHRIRKDRQANNLIWGINRNEHKLLKGASSVK